MFFFFWDEQLGDNIIVQEAFNKICFERLLVEGYCDMNPIFGRPKISKAEMAAKLSLIKSPLEKLYRQDYPKDMDDVEEKLLPVLGEFISREIILTNFDFFSIVYYVFQAFRTYERKSEIMQELFEQWKLAQDELIPIAMDIKITGGIVYNAHTIDLRIINTINRYMDLLNEIGEVNFKLFYRGHSNVSYKLEPSIYRDEIWLKNEKKMYQELLINCPNDFSKLKNHIEILAEMQHYGLPTRLLDVTQNPLIALYFACEDLATYAGEVIIFVENKDKIKYPQSDTVAMLSSLPVFTYEEQKEFYILSRDSSLTSEEFNRRIERLIHEVKMERPGFQSKVNPIDLRSCLFCIPARVNKRLDKQEGAFIVCGLLDEKYGEKKENSLSNLRVKNSENKKIVCIIENKDRLQKHLNTLGINKARVYPEIDDVADYIKNHVNEI